MTTAAAADSRCQHHWLTFMRSMRLFDRRAVHQSSINVNPAPAKKKLVGNWKTLLKIMTRLAAVLLGKQAVEIFRTLWYFASISSTTRMLSLLCDVVFINVWTLGNENTWRRLFCLVYMETHLLLGWGCCTHFGLEGGSGVWWYYFGICSQTIRDWSYSFFGRYPSVLVVYKGHHGPCNVDLAQDKTLKCLVFWGRMSSWWWKGLLPLPRDSKEIIPPWHALALYGNRGIRKEARKRNDAAAFTVKNQSALCAVFLAVYGEQFSCWTTN